MTLLLTNEDVEQVLTMADAIDVLERLYVDLGSGSAVYRGRTDLFTPTVAEIGADVPAAHQFKTLDGAIPRLQAASIRVTSDVVAFPVVDGNRRRTKIPAASGGRYVGLVFLFSSASGELLAVLQDGVLQRVSVGAINAIGARYCLGQSHRLSDSSEQADRPVRRSRGSWRCDRSRRSGSTAQRPVKRGSSPTRPGLPWAYGCAPATASSPRSTARTSW